jgi:uncharacterized protein GlcG (DUF336 family)
MRLSATCLTAVALLLTSCGDESGSSGGGGSIPTPAPSPTATATPQDLTAPAQEALTVAEVGKIVAQAAAQATADGRPAVIAVVDRVGNVLALFRMIGAPANAHIPEAPDGSKQDAQGLDVPAEAAAIAKALTGAYLSSGGNAFSTRTASMIVQQHFPPAPTTAGLESGPLFGVQFSQLPCSDLAARVGQGMIGPKRSPLGLAADPGGFPLYKNGALVGGVGVLGDGVYGFDPNVLDLDDDADERAALAGTVGFEAPEAIRANRITVDGTALRYSDADYAKLSPVSSATYAATSPALGGLVALPAYFPTAAIQPGTPYGSEASGLRRATGADFADSRAFVLSDGAGANRYPIRAGTDAIDVGNAISAQEARTILEQAFAVMARARGQIRQPLDSRAQVTISLVDTRGQVLGIVRGPDAPVFGIDVSLQKARTASFFSGPSAGSDLLGDPSADVRGFVGAARAFFADPAALTGKYAFSDRGNGNISRPFFPDGELGRPPGPFGRPIGKFNPFSTGLQSALIVGNLAQHLAFVTGASASDPQRCTALPDAVPGQNRLQNGVQVFPGSVPVYRGNTLVGGLGVSGDGIDQDDMISFLGLNNAGKLLGTLGNAPVAIRSDQIVVRLSDGKDVRLRYVSCPFAPFLDSAEQNVCQGL